MATSRGFDFPCFRDKVVVVTDVISDIGAATAREFAKDGARLALHGTRPERIELVVEDCVNLGIPRENICTYYGELLDMEEIKSFIEEVVCQLGGIDVLINNSGFTHETVPGEMDSIKLDEMLEEHLKRSWNTIKCSRQYLAKRKGCIVNVTSHLASSAVRPDRVEYAIAKGAMEVMTKNLVHELSSSGIRINDVAPGLIKAQTPEQMEETNVLGCAGQPEHVAHVIQFLASSAAAYVTGAEILVDGGLTRGTFNTTQASY